MKQRHRVPIQHQWSVVVLIANGFEEQDTVGCIHTFREAGVSVSLVSLAAGSVTGSRGIVLQPDFSLDQLSADDRTTLTVLSGGRSCTTALLTDPRVHRLLSTITEAGGRVALLGSIDQDLEQLLDVPLSRQDTWSVPKFIAKLLGNVVDQPGTRASDYGRVVDDR